MFPINRDKSEKRLFLLTVCYSITKYDYLYYCFYIIIFHGDPISRCLGRVLINCKKQKLINIPIEIRAYTHVQLFQKNLAQGQELNQEKFNFRNI